MFRKIPTALLQLRYQKRRLMVALLGVSFTVVIIFMQLGLRDALFDSSVRFHKSLKGDCFLISQRSPSLVAMDNFTSRRLFQTLAFSEVEFVAPVYVRFIQWKNFQNRDYWRNIFLIGFDLRDEIFDLPGVAENLDKLKLPDHVLFDRNSRSEYGEVVKQLEQQEKIQTEIRYEGNNKTIKIVGLFSLGTSFGVDGNLLTSNLNFIRIVKNQTIGSINLGVIKLKPGVNIQEFKVKLREYLPKDVKVLTKEELIHFEKNYWYKGTALGFIFTLGVALGIVVGVIIVYQILYTNISEHLSEYATLKAIGYKHKYLLFMVLQQSTLISLLGYIPGIIISELLYEFTQRSTLLPIAMTFNRAIQVFFLTLIMCFLSGITAIRKLKSADPAEIF
ncbi:MAG TPA: ABC transporter [Cyanothece sp. UBA12306]|nr:ABC transporter [Cyanothece sp. UBA12306]